MKIVLVGGGHAHVQVVHDFGLHPWADAQLTLISSSRYTPYSGMLPGFLAGHYKEQEIYFDLKSKCERAGVNFIEDEVRNLDTNLNQVSTSNRGTLSYDFASLDVGSRPLQQVSRDLSHLLKCDWFLPLKPVSQLVGRWQRMREALKTWHASRPPKLAMVGGGVSGVEVALALRFALRNLPHVPEIHLFEKNEQLLVTQGKSARRKVQFALEKNGVHVHTSASVSQIGERLLVIDHRPHAFDYIILATEAHGPEWFKTSSLEVDDHNFVRVDENLKVRGTRNLFAVGDCAAFPRPIPKSGVVAVRQGPVLISNLQRVLVGAPLRPYSPQRRQLALVSLGHKRAIAAYGPLALEGAYLWRIKDRIDREFMRRFG